MAICSYCQRGRFKGFEIVCELTGELLPPRKAACSDYVELDHKDKPDP